MDDILKAIIAGRQYYVERTIKKCPSMAKEPEALRLAVLYNRHKIVSTLLEAGANVTNTLIVLACRKGYNKVTKTLLKYGAQDKDKAFLEAVCHNHTRCVSTLITQGHVCVSIHEDEALFDAVKNRNKHMIKILLQNGANIDAREGELLITACTEMANQEQSQSIDTSMDMMEFLLANGADPNMKESQALRICVSKRYYRAVELLLDHGADDSVTDNLYQDHVMRNLISKWRKENRYKRLKRAIRSSFDRDVWKWQSMCRPEVGNSSNLTLLRQQAKCMGINENLSNLSKMQMCAALAKKTEPLIQTDPTMEGVDLYGDELASIPKWKLYEVHGRVYNIFDLIRMVKKGYTNCPYTRLPIPVNDIRDRCKFLERTLTRNYLNDFNLVEQVRQTPLITREIELKTLLLNNLWCRMEYPPSIDILFKSPESTINDMVSKLYMAANDHIMYPMLSTYRRWEILHASTLARKREMFIELLIDIAKVQDQETSVRLNTLQILFQHYREDGSNRLGEDGDLLTFMLEEEDDDDFFPTLAPSRTPPAVPPFYLPPIVALPWYMPNATGIPLPPDDDDEEDDPSNFNF